MSETPSNKPTEPTIYLVALADGQRLVGEIIGRSRLMIRLQQPLRITQSFVNGAVSSPYQAVSLAPLQGSDIHTVEINADHVLYTAQAGEICAKTYREAVGWLSNAAGLSAINPNTHKGKQTG